MNRRRFTMLAGLLLVAPSAPRAADVLALLPTTGINVDAGTLAAAGEVLRGHLGRAGFKVRPASTATPDIEASPAQAAAAARMVGAGRAAVLRLVTLGAVLRARLTVYDLAGTQVHNDEMAADAVADLDPALARLAKGYAAGSTAARSAELDTVTQKEAVGVQKVQAASATGFRLGFLRATGTGGGDVTATGAGVYWIYDTRHLLIDVSVDGYWGHHAQQLAAGFGGYLPLSQGNLAPYLGGGLRYAWTSYGHGWGSGIQPALSAGLMIGRLSNVSLRAQMDWWWNAFENGGRNANGPTWSFGVQF
jgi:hypothetical protein